MSMWQAANGALSDFKDRGFKSWPNPFDGMLKDIDVLACQDTFQAKVKMVGIEFANWFWTNIVPSPVEITRKTITGSYKCGFYLNTKWGSPVDIPWEDAGVSEMLLEITSPAVQALFFLWASETTFDAVSRAQSIVYAMEKCGLDRDECLLMDGLGEAFAGGAPNGTPNAYVVLQDRHHLYASPGGDVTTFKPGYLQMDAFGKTLSAGCDIFHSNIGFYSGVNPLPGQEAAVVQGAIPSGNIRKWSLHFGGLVDAGSFRVNWDCLNNAVGLAHASIIVDRWTISWHPEKPQKPCAHFPQRQKFREGGGHWWIPQT
jgi:hypothetical protein